MIDRTFQDIPEDKITEADHHPFLIGLGWWNGLKWEELLKSKRVLIVSEAGAGKTYECEEEARRRYENGEPAFFLDLASLATQDLRSLLTPDRVRRLDAWKNAQSEVAVFFLDSIDELNLTQGLFRVALNRLRTEIDGQQGRVKVVITTRPIRFDEALIREVLPVPPLPSPEPSAERFADLAMRTNEGRSANDREPPDWRTVGLIPLSDDQIVEFARIQGVDDADRLLEDLRLGNALEFARRPQDLIEICAGWRGQKRIRTHREQVEANVHTKLLPRDDRSEPAELSNDRAIEGASRLALAMLMTRRLTLRHSAAADGVGDEPALDPREILKDWQPAERRALLERPLFGFASYGRVRFHHRSVLEFLAACRLHELLGLGMTRRALKRLLFAESRGSTIVRPSKRPVAAWLALDDPEIFNFLRDNDPAALLSEGDPGSLSRGDIRTALRAYAERYGQGGWRRLRIPQAQLRRIASADIADEIAEIWNTGVSNPEVRILLLNLVEFGRIQSCSSIAYDLVNDTVVPVEERIEALDALIALGDARLPAISESIVEAEGYWPVLDLLGALFRLFPSHMSVAQFCNGLRRIEHPESRSGSLDWELPRFLRSLNLDATLASALRDGLVQLVQDGLRWDKETRRFESNRPRLAVALAAVCAGGLEFSREDEWLRACILALRVYHRGGGDSEPLEDLRRRLLNLTSTEVSRLFWAEDNFVCTFRTFKNCRDRLNSVLTHEGATHLDAERDAGWIRTALGDTSRGRDERCMLLEAAAYLRCDGKIWDEHVEGLRPLIADTPEFAERIDDLLKPSPHEAEHRRYREESESRRRERAVEEQRDRESWISLWRELTEHPQEVLSNARRNNHVWNLWRVLFRQRRDDTLESWDRQFIEQSIGKEAADFLRVALMAIWREERPTLPSERGIDGRKSTLAWWEVGLAGIYAEAEDTNWINGLTAEEVALAVRYSLLEMNRLPGWMDALAETHPTLVADVLNQETRWELGQATDDDNYSRLLHLAEYASTHVARLLIDSLLDWIKAGLDDSNTFPHTPGAAKRTQQVVSIVEKHGEAAALRELVGVAMTVLTLAPPVDIRQIWLPVLLRLDVTAGIDALERELESAPGEAVNWFARLFGDRRDAIELGDGKFVAPELLRLLRLAYRHVRSEDDAHHVGIFTPGPRDDAERARSNILSALLDTQGAQGWDAKMEMAADPMFASFRDRVLHVAHENWAVEVDADILSESQAVLLDTVREAPPSTNEAMFGLLTDRLLQISELLVSDYTPREMWALVKKEVVMRRAIARELKLTANSLYTVDQEGVTADEKETDIRLRSVLGTHEAVIELKIGDKRTARDLIETIADQLVKKYMAPEGRRAGALLVTFSGEWRGTHPVESRQIDMVELTALLLKEARRVECATGGELLIAIHVLDLRPRLPVERPKA